MADDLETFGGGTKIGRWTFGIREIVLAVVVVILLILAVVFALLYGIAQNDLNSSKDAVGYCTSDSCLKNAAYVANMMNQSVDPCEDFFQYACGNYEQVKPVLPDGPDDRNVFNDMNQVNDDNLLELVRSSSDATHDTSSEKKMKDFYASCINMYQRQNIRGLPIIRDIIPALGGWSVFGTFKSDSFDLKSVYQKVRTDYWTDAFFRFRDPWETDGVITLEPGGLSVVMSNSSYTQTKSPINDDYRKFVSRVGGFLADDAQELLNPPQGDPTKRDALLKEFVDDVMLVETNLANIAESVTSGDEDGEMMTIGDLNKYTNNVIDFTDYISHLFNDASVTATTKVVVVHKEYFRSITNSITSLPDANRNRVISNYLIWRVVETYTEKLSWGYIHANREVYTAIHKEMPHMDPYQYCFADVDKHFKDVLSALYIQNFFDKETKLKVKDIVSQLSTTFKAQIDKITWLDDATKKYAKDKLAGVSFQTGNPKWIEDMNLVDAVYNGLTISRDDFFGNLMNITKIQQKWWNQQVRNPETREGWKVRVYTPSVTYLRWHNIISTTAGVLRSPIYDKSLPHHSTFGSIGSLLGLYLYHVIDEHGRMYDKQGKLLDKTWWSQASLDKYKPVKDCVTTLLKDTNLDKVHPVSGQELEWRNGAVQEKSEFIAFVMGIRLAQQAYLDWMADPDRKAEQRLLGVGLNEQQMIYLAHTQMFCHSATHRLSFSGDSLTTLAMGQLPEFSKAFNCKAGSKMNPAKRCNYN